MLGNHGMSWIGLGALVIALSACSTEPPTSEPADPQPTSFHFTADCEETQDLFKGDHVEIRIQWQTEAAEGQLGLSNLSDYPNDFTDHGVSKTLPANSSGEWVSTFTGAHVGLHTLYFNASGPNWGGSGPLCTFNVSDPGLPTVLWTFPTGLADFDRHWWPSVHDGLVYIEGVAFETVYVLEEATGAVQLEYADVFGSSLPIADDGTAYLRNGDTIFATSSAGTEHWRFSLRSNASLALDHNGILYTYKYDEADEAHYLWALDATGSVLWKTPVTYSGESTPIIDSSADIVYFHDSSTLYSVDADDGAVAWTVPAPSIGFPTASAIDADGTLYAGVRINNQTWLRAVDPTAGDDLWTYGPVRGKSAVIDNNGAIYIMVAERLVALDPTDGSELWTYPVTYTDTNPVIAEDGSIVLLADDHTLIALDSSGEVGWQLDLTTAAGFSNITNALGPVLSEDGTLLVHISGNDQNVVDGWEPSQGKLIAISSSPLCIECPWPAFKGNGQHKGSR